MPQITRDTEFGRRLYELGADTKYKIFVEVGTFDGQGSTKCIIEGLESRTPEDLSGAGLFSMEANLVQWAVASQYWKHRNPPARILKARLAEKMMEKDEILAHPLFSRVKEHYALWYEQDCQDFKETKHVNMRRCDVAVLDGGEFSGYYDWKALEPLEPKVVCLDDIFSIKNEKVFREIGASLLYDCVWMTSERNGSCIFVRRAEADAAEKSSTPSVEDGDHQSAHIRMAEGDGAAREAGGVSGGSPAEDA